MNGQFFQNQSNSGRGALYGNGSKSDRSKTVAALLCFFLGGLGIHRFYVGKAGTGILWLLTGGCFAIGVIVDFVMILCGAFTDNDGAYLK